MRTHDDARTTRGGQPDLDAAHESYIAQCIKITAVASGLSDLDAAHESYVAQCIKITAVASGLSDLDAAHESYIAQRIKITAVASGLSVQRPVGCCTAGSVTRVKHLLPVHTLVWGAGGPRYCPVMPNRKIESGGRWASASGADVG